ncbi:MAG: carboxypeptidase-like regulatory domain-containing protein, partial [Planctomycetota bacterium]
MNIFDRGFFPLAIIGTGILMFLVGWFFLPTDDPSAGNEETQQKVTGNEDNNPAPSTDLNSTDTNPVAVIEDLPEMRFSGQVIDVSTGLPVPGATVAFRNAAGSIPLGHSRTRTGGFFAVDVVESKNAMVVVRCPGYAPGRWQWSFENQLPDSTAYSSAHPEELLLAISPESVLWVSIDSSKTDPPEKPYVEVRMIQPRTARELGEAVEIPPQLLVDGELRMGGLLAGRHLVSIRSGARVLARREVEIGEGEEREVIFRLGPSIQVHGIVLRNNIPVEGGIIQTWCRETQASSSIPVAFDGHFETLLP